jgi:hypothetical protein
MFGFGLTVDNVNEALPQGLRLLRDHGKPAVSRGIETIRVPGPVMTIYNNPTRRVLFDEVRDANPFFHLIESLWILGGSNKVALPKYFLSSIDRFSDDGVTFHGAYGARMRAWTGNDWCPRNATMDQLQHAVDVLREKPDTRQCVVSIWDPSLDLGAETKDVPCNDMVMFDIVDGALNMTVCNRSNDVIWGAYGANAVQFSMLQEWMAAMVGVEVGKYVQMSNNYHVYTDNPFWHAFLKADDQQGDVWNPYMDKDCHPYAIAFNAHEAIAVRTDCEDMCEMAELRRHPLSFKPRSQFFGEVVRPIVQGYDEYKNGYYDRAFRSLLGCAAPDWRLACTAWVLRRQERAAIKAAEVKA